MSVNKHLGIRFRQAFLQPAPLTFAYRQWCVGLIRQRFWLAVGLAFAYISLQGIVDFYEVFVYPERLLRDLALIQRIDLLAPIRQQFIWHKVTAFSLLGLLIGVWHSPWGRKHPSFMLIGMPWAIAFIPEMVLGAIIGIPRYPSIIMFMAQAVIAPIHWRLHLVAQLVPMLFYFTFYPLLGLTSIGSQSIYTLGGTVEMLLVCAICEIGVCLYEHSKQAELAANRRVKLLVDSITHDLRTPVMGSLMMLQALQKRTINHRAIHMSAEELTQLINGNHRLLGLMNMLLDTHVLAESGAQLKQQEEDLSQIVASVLTDLQPDFNQHKILLINHISSDLPLVDVDAHQIGRVFHNLLHNAMTHNAPGITITLDAQPFHSRALAQRRSYLKIIVQDNGIGIAHAQAATLFDAYTRGQTSSYTPGSGLGLYICRQIVLAHGGQIGLERVDEQTCFWFTLPLGQK
jgi:signal transduction histidine kinase